MQSSLFNFQKKSFVSLSNFSLKKGNVAAAAAAALFDYELFSTKSRKQTKIFRRRNRFRTGSEQQGPLEELLS
jgi:hypothetical protein